MHDTGDTGIPDIKIYDDPEAVAEAATARFVELAAGSMEARGSFSVALAGGSTPKRIYELLASDDWRERVLSGLGLFNVYSFLRDTNFAPEPDWLAAEIEGGDKSARTAAISRAALSNKSELAAKALDMFVEMYGAMAGNLALILKSAGGLYIGGGIAPKIIEKLTDGKFMGAFRDKGRMSALAESVPVHVILDDKTALYGAARCALINAEG